MLKPFRAPSGLKQQRGRSPFALAPELKSLRRQSLVVKQILFSTSHCAFLAGKAPRDADSEREGDRSLLNINRIPRQAPDR